MTIVAEKQLELGFDDRQVVKTQGIRWSAGGQICFIDGFAWGVDTELNNICLGREARLREAIANPKLKSFDPAIDQVIEFERVMIKRGQEEYGRRPEGTVKLRAQKPKRSANKRIRPLRVAGHKRYNLGQPKAAKKLTLHRT